MPLIFQYGSNCDASRLNSPERLNGNARDLGQAETVGQYEIAFDVWSGGNNCAASDLRRRSGRHARGVLYDVPAEWILGRKTNGRTLEQIEGTHYEPKRIRIKDSAGRISSATTFLVKPSSRQKQLATSVEYVRHIVEGLRAHDTPEEYVQRVIEVAIRTNRRAMKSEDEEIRKIESLSTP
jgi:cation transport regulator ChaC